MSEDSVKYTPLKPARFTDKEVMNAVFAEINERKSDNFSRKSIEMIESQIIGVVASALRRLIELQEGKE